IVEAADAGEALRAIQARRPALVVAAVASPRIDGAALLHALKADPGLADIPVVLTSNRHSEALKVRMLKAGADAYLVEPFRADELRARVQNLLVVEEREKRMRLLAREAQLKMLRYQLNPHFLFNALNAIRALVLSDAARSRQLVTALAEYLRYSLRTANDLEVSLQEEVTSVQSYLEIEKIRFEEDLDVAVEVQPGAADCRVPGVLLQPLVENAVKYGMATSPMPLRLRILGTIGGGRLHLEVANTGRWQPPEQTQGTSTGIGLRNLRQRLQRFYPGRHRFAVSEEAGWVRAVIDIDLPILST
ncbi:MAG: histidine kinase, partial [Rhodothermales bacterium]|nr:histidine kinase [Rhodothermales bacterium]